MQNDPTNRQTYWTKRAEEQLKMAKEATDLKVRTIHLDLAAMYAAESEQYKANRAPSQL